LIILIKCPIKCTSTNSTSTAIITDTLTTTESTNDIIDIGCCLDKKVSDELKYKLLTNVWVPDEKFTFPMSGNRNLKFQLN